jgi:uncharacterized protein
VNWTPSDQAGVVMTNSDAKKFRPVAANQGSCPICSRASEISVRPFCSKRCADVDLSRWLGGVYAIPVVDADDDEDGATVDAGSPDGRGRGFEHDA